MMMNHVMNVYLVLKSTSRKIPVAMYSGYLITVYRGLGNLV